MNLCFILFIENSRFLRLNPKKQPYQSFRLYYRVYECRPKQTIRIQYTIQYYELMHLWRACYTGIFLHTINKY